MPDDREDPIIMHCWTESQWMMSRLCSVIWPNH